MTKQSPILSLNLETHQFARLHLASGSQVPNASSTLLSISSDGRFVAFSSAASNLVAGDRNGVTDFFVRDRTLGPPNCSCIEAVGHRPAGASALVAGCRAMGATSDSRPTSPSARSIRARAAAPTCMTGRKARKAASASTPGQAAIIPPVLPTFPWMLASWRSSPVRQIWSLEIRTHRVMSSFAIARTRQPLSVSVSRQLECKGTATDPMQGVLGWAHDRLQFGCDRSHPGHRSGTDPAVSGVPAAALSAAGPVLSAGLRSPAHRGMSTTCFAPAPPRRKRTLVVPTGKAVPGPALPLPARGGVPAARGAGRSSGRALGVS